VKASRYGAANTKVIMKNLIEWSAADELGDRHLRWMYDGVVKLYNRYFKHAEARLGGVFEFDGTNETHPEKYVQVSRDKQKEALDYIMDELLSQYDWMKTDELEKRLGSLEGEIMKSQGKRINGLVDRMVLVRMFTCASQSKDPYTTSEYLGDITKRLFEFSGKKQKSNWMRNLQVEYIKSLKELVEKNAKSKGHEFNNLVLADVLSELKKIETLVIKKAQYDKSGHFNYLSYILK
jgi:hypothetical protein